MRCLPCAVLMLLMCSTSRAEFVVGDADLQDGVYELRYYTQRNILVKNGASASLDGTPLGELFLTNSGNTLQPAHEYFGTDSGVRYLQATGAYGGWGGGVNSTWNTSAAATMGWNFSELSQRIAKVEVLTWQGISQFVPWNDEALGDRVFADVATPAVFGAGTYTNIYTLISDNADGNKPASYFSTTVIDITNRLTTQWLADPQKLELRFGYELVNTDIPSRHLQLFRDTSTSGLPDTSFMLRVTTVPEPGGLVLLASGLIGVLAGVLVSRRR
ncbi:MAG: PEP-CTERM sorting domain-containing protein [Planctomycetota bacterium]